jgi:hypothetical protein
MVSQKKNWCSMQINNVGNLTDIVQGGGGKLSLTGGDPGDPRKPRGQERPGGPRPII